MLEQEVFELVSRHLFDQGKQATNGEGHCMYRAPDGCQCAVGCVIEDDEYNADYEYFRVEDLFLQFLLMISQKQ